MYLHYYFKKSQHLVGAYDEELLLAQNQALFTLVNKHPRRTDMEKSDYPSWLGSD